MADVFSKSKRSSIMAANRGRGNLSTEISLRVRLASKGVSGWRMNARDVFGNPDFVFEDRKVAIFADGCFWHGCRQCKGMPETNSEFWERKIKGNIKRDNQVTRKLTAEGWQVLRFWEHDIKRHPQQCITQIQDAIS